MKDWAVILGASSGIGAECALRLAEKGINIYGVYLRKKNHHIDEFKKQLSKFNVEVIYKKDLTENPQPTKQLIRFGVEENNKKNVSLFLLYDRVNNHSEQIHLGTMLNFPHKIRLKTVVSYQKKQIASKSDKEFFLSLGIGMHL